MFLSLLSFLMNQYVFSIHFTYYQQLTSSLNRRPVYPWVNLGLQMKYWSDNHNGTLGASTTKFATIQGPKIWVILYWIWLNYWLNTFSNNRMEIRKFVDQDNINKYLTSSWIDPRPNVWIWIQKKTRCLSQPPTVDLFWRIEGKMRNLWKAQQI